MKRFFSDGVKRQSGLMGNRPRPVPLGNSRDQREFEELVKQTESKIDKIGHERHPDAEQPLEQSFEGDKNPQTGEIGGPKGVEPTRYGDWERKGRVFDF